MMPVRRLPAALAAFAALAVLCLGAGLAAAQDLRVVPGKLYAFLGPSGQGKTTTIFVSPGYVVVNPGTSDEIVGDLVRRDIFARGPGGGAMSMKEMMGRFAGAGAGATSGGGAMDPDAEFDALFEGMPPSLKRQLKAQFSALPRADAIKAIQVLRGQMGLPPVTPGDLPERPASAVQATGQTETRDGVTLHEYLVAGDRILAADAGDMPLGEALRDGMVAFGNLYREISQGMPVADSSFFRIGELDGRVPWVVQTADGETFIFGGVSDGEARVP